MLQNEDEVMVISKQDGQEQTGSIWSTDMIEEIKVEMEKGYVTCILDGLAFGAIYSFFTHDSN